VGVNDRQQASQTSRPISGTSSSATFAVSINNRHRACSTDWPLIALIRNGQPSTVRTGSHGMVVGFHKK
jgi:hypothetical protein